MSRLARSLTLALVLPCSVPCIASAAWPPDPNANVPLCTAAGDQTRPASVSDGAGGAIVAWEDGRSGAGIFAQRVNAAGVPQWTADGVQLFATGAGQYPTITSDGAGGAIVTWQDYRHGDYDIYVQRVNAAGLPQWNINGVALSTAEGPQILPKIVADGAGGAIVTWWDNFTNDIYAGRVNAAGVPQWIAPLCTAAGAQTSPAIASDGAGGAIVTWNDARSGPVNDIYAQRVNAAGVPQWTIDGVALCTAAGGQHDPTIVADGAGGAIVTWYDGRNGVDMDIYAQRVSAAGVPQWTADGVALCTATGGQYAPTIVTDGAGGAVLTWSDNRNGTDLDIYAQRVSAAGVPQWTADGVALCTAANGQGNPTIVADGTGGAIVTWSDERSVSGVDATNDIYAQRVSASGVPQWTADGVAVCTAAGLQSDPAIVSDGGSGAIVAWHDHRSGTTFDVYAQNVNADGTLGSPGLSVPATTVAAHFGLSRVEPNPSIGALRASISLADDTPAILGVYDLTGRCLESQPLGSLGAGAHIVSLNSNGARWPPGIYELRLEQGTRSAFCKVAIVR